MHPKTTLVLEKWDFYKFFLSHARPLPEKTKSNNERIIIALIKWFTILRLL